MMKEWIYTVVACVVAFEFIEHIGLPLFWGIKNRKSGLSLWPSGDDWKNLHSRSVGGRSGQGDD